MKIDINATITKVVVDNNHNMTTMLNQQFTTAMTKLTSEHNEQMKQVAEANEADRASTANMFRNIMLMGEEQKQRDFERERVNQETKAGEQHQREERECKRNIESIHLLEKELRRDKDIEYLRESVNILMYNEENESSETEGDESFASVNDIMDQDTEPTHNVPNNLTANGQPSTGIIYTSEGTVGKDE